MYRIFYLAPLFLIFMMGFQEFTYRFYLATDFRELTRQQEEVLPPLLEDHGAVAKDAFFSVRGFSAGASAYLNPRVVWIGENDTPFRDLAVEGVTLLKAPEGLKETLLNRDEKWPDGFEAVTFPSDLNLAWMAELSGYDYWDLEDENRAYTEMFEDVIDGNREVWSYLANRPKPDFTEMVVFARIRLLTGIRKRNPLSALREVRHLAELVYSTEDLAGQLAAMEMLADETQAYTYLVKKKAIKPEEWRAFPTTTVARTRRAMMATVSFFNVLSIGGSVDKLFGQGLAVAGRCAAIGFGTQALSYFEPQMGTYFPMEQDFRPQLAELAAAVNGDKVCRLKHVKEFWKQGLAQFRTWHPPLSPNLSEIELASWPIPYLRKAAGLDLALRGMPHFFDPYLKVSAEN